MAERITSRTNPLMAHIRRLASSRSHRCETGEYLGDGVKLLEEAVRWGAPLTAVVYTPGTALPSLPPEVRQVEVPADVMRSVSPMEAPQGRCLWRGRHAWSRLGRCAAGGIWPLRESRTRGT